MDEQGQIHMDPEEFGRRAAEAAAPILRDAVREAMLDAAKTVPPEKPKDTEWKGGRPTDQQIDQMLQKGQIANMDRIVLAVEDIRNRLDQLLSGGASL